MEWKIWCVSISESLCPIPLSPIFISSYPARYDNLRWSPSKFSTTENSGDVTKVRIAIVSHVNYLILHLFPGFLGVYNISAADALDLALTQPGDSGSDRLPKKKLLITHITRPHYKRPYNVKQQSSCFWQSYIRLFFRISISATSSNYSGTTHGTAIYTRICLSNYAPYSGFCRPNTTL